MNDPIQPLTLDQGIEGSNPSSPANSPSPGRTPTPSRPTGDDAPWLSRWLSDEPLLELVVDFTGLGLHCQRCGDGHRVRLYRVAGNDRFLDWMCAAIEAAEAAGMQSAEAGS